MATQVKQFLNGYKDDVSKSLRDASKPWTKVFDTVEEKTGVDRVNIFVGECGISWRRHRMSFAETPM